METTIKIQNQTAEELAKFLSNILDSKKPKFLFIKNYKKKNGEITNVLVSLNTSYKNAQKRALLKLEKFKENEKDSLILKAIEKITDSINKSLSGENLSNQMIAQRETYLKVSDAIKIHEKSKEIYIHAQVIKKQILIEGEYKKVKSKPLTIARRTIEKELRTSKYRNYKIENFDSITIDKNRIVIEL